MVFVNTDFGVARSELDGDVVCVLFGFGCIGDDTQQFLCEVRAARAAAGGRNRGDSPFAGAAIWPIPAMTELIASRSPVLVPPSTPRCSLR